MTQLVNQPAQRGAHALVIGVGEYPWLDGGTQPRFAHFEGMGQLSSPPISVGSSQGVYGSVGAITGSASDQIAAVRKAIQRAESSHLNRGSLAKLRSFARSLKESAGVTRSAVDASRLAGPGGKPAAAGLSFD